MDMSEYQRIFLGGDVLFYGARDKQSLENLNQTFDLDSDDFLWTVGNHDYENADRDLLRRYTKRKTYYSNHKNGITTIVLNTNFEGPDCEKSREQFQLIKNVTDTIKNSSHLILLHHHIFWSEVLKKFDMNGIVNIDLPWTHFLCDTSPKVYHNLLHPMLVEVQKRGVQVIMLGGDFGQVWTEFQAKDDAGIVYLGAGLIKSTHDYKGKDYPGNDKVIVFTHDLTNRKLSWEFVGIDPEN